MILYPKSIYSEKEEEAEKNTSSNHPYYNPSKGAEEHLLSSGYHTAIMHIYCVLLYYPSEDH